MPSLNVLGWDAFFERQVTGDERRTWEPARVVWESRERYRLSTGEAEWNGELAGRLRHAAAASRADLPVVGDWVLAALPWGALPRTECPTPPVPQTRPAARIYRLLARRTRFSRAAAGRSTDEQVVAANIDTLLLVTSFNRDFNPRRVDRYLALTWQSGARPVVVLNKSDLCTDHGAWLAEITPVLQGVPVLVTSAREGSGMAELQAVIRTGGTTALLGSSGVGKSTLINALIGDCRQEVLPIRDGDDRGRHSTTARQLFCVPGGGVVIDTPGMRELQLWDADAGLERTFEDVRTLAAGCRFRDCTHRVEPGCAVIAAVSRGDLSADRLDSYHRLLRENDFLRSRHDEQARSEQRRKAKQSARAVRLQARLRRR